MRLTCVTVDCADPRTVARFWSAALAWGDVEATGDGGWVIRPPGDGLRLEFVEVPEAKVVKNRLHFGTSAGSLSALDREIARLEGLGAAVA